MILTLYIIMYIIYDIHIVHNYFFRKVTTFFKKFVTMYPQFSKLKVSEERISDVKNEFLTQ